MRRRTVPASLLAIVMIVWEPLVLAAAASSGLSRLSSYGLPAYLLLVYRGVVAGFGIAAGRALWASRDGARTLALTWVVLACAGALLTLLTPYFPSNRTPGEKTLDLSLAVIWYAAWGTYLAFARDRSSTSV